MAGRPRSEWLKRAMILIEEHGPMTLEELRAETWRLVPPGVALRTARDRTKKPDYRRRRAHELQRAGAHRYVSTAFYNAVKRGVLVRLEDGRFALPHQGINGYKPSRSGHKTRPWALRIYQLVYERGPITTNEIVQELFSIIPAKQAATSYKYSNRKRVTPISKAEAHVIGCRGLVHRTLKDKMTGPGDVMRTEDGRWKWVSEDIPA